VPSTFRKRARNAASRLRARFGRGPGEPEGQRGEGLDLIARLEHQEPSQLWFQLAEIVKDRTYLRHGIEVGPGDVVIDAGANVGVAAAFFLEVCEAGTVHSFEPVPEIHRMLVRNLRGAPGAHAHMVGLSERNETVEFTYYEGAAAMSSRYADPGRDHATVKAALEGLGISEEEAEERIEGDFEPRRVSCRLETLSSVIRREGIERIDLLKIDVERAELDVLRGIEPEDWPRVRQVVTEVHDEDGRLADICALLEDNGFEVVTDQEPNRKGSSSFVVYARAGREQLS
jgi:FkbM family methyltransferase